MRKDELEMNTKKYPRAQTLWETSSSCDRNVPLAATRSSCNGVSMSRVDGMADCDNDRWLGKNAKKGHRDHHKELRVQGWLARTLNTTGSFGVCWLWHHHTTWPATGYKNDPETSPHYGLLPEDSDIRIPTQFRYITVAVCSTGSIRISSPYAPKVTASELPFEFLDEDGASTESRVQTPSLLQFFN